MGGPKVVHEEWGCDRRIADRNRMINGWQSTS
jgi:hypothetical protein